MFGSGVEKGREGDWSVHIGMGLGWRVEGGEEELVIHTELHLSFDMSGMISSIGTNGWRDGEMVRLTPSPSQYVRCYDTHVS